MSSKWLRKIKKLNIYVPEILDAPKLQSILSIGKSPGEDTRPTAISGTSTVPNYL
ncbi:hypothetical protein [Brunnivagina elsteri]|uniref:hypothetical protein n=1 Tax=Brunnivagina elsteri TaxID=1247191 RepID=UPI001B8013A3|nr:hypothetical protein [Calothrix elsteri]